MRCAIPSAIPVVNDRKLAGVLTKRSSKITGPAKKTLALPTIKTPHNLWNLPVQLRSGEGPLKHTTLRMAPILEMGIRLPSRTSSNPNPYVGTVPIPEECIGHVQKTLKKRLMKKGSGYTSLSQSKADRITHLYSLEVVQHRGKSTTEIHDGLQVLMTHTKEIHDRCPPRDTSWCYFQKRLAKFDIDGGSAPPTTRKPYLTPAEYSRALNVFTVWVLVLLKYQQHGKTQNSNESLHNML